jgi:hypothetical protein
MTRIIEGSSKAGSATGVDRRAGRHANTTLLVLYLSLGGLSFAVLQSLVAPAMSTIAHDVNASTGDISWVLTAYLLAASVLTPILGRLGDMVGKRRVLIGVLAVLAVGTLVAALAPSLTVLIVGRVLQGAAGAMAALADELTVTGGDAFTRRVDTVPGLPNSSGVFRLAHPEAGMLRLAYETLELPADDDQRLLVYLPADAATSAALDRLMNHPLQPLRLVVG